MSAPWVLLAGLVLAALFGAAGARPAPGRGRRRRSKGGMIGGSASYPHVDPWR